MSKVNRFSLLAFLMYAFAGIAVPNASYGMTLKVCYDHWPPMTMFPIQGAPARGVVIDMVEHIYSSKGYQLAFYEVPLARGLDMVAEGLCDMLPEYLYSADSDSGFVYANEATFSYDSAFVIRKEDDWRYQGIHSLAGKRIATGPGWDYSSMSTEYQSHIDDPKNADFIETIAGHDDVVDRIFKMIKDNRVDLYADNDLVLQHVLNELKLDKDLQIVRPGLEKKLVEIPIFSKKIPDDKRQELINLWNHGRLTIKGEKEQTFLNKYKVSLEE